MRTIEFRAKYIDNSGWVYGYLTQCYIEVGDKLPLEIKIKGSGATYFIDENTIGQFTGLCDKNGKKIFEGDIVKGTIVSSWAKQKIKCKVIYEKDRFVCIDIDGGVHKVMFGKDIAVIGNIYDNPELLKGE